MKEEVVYRQTHFRIGQWLVGISLGYIMYQMKDESSEYRIRKVSIGNYSLLLRHLRIDI